MEASSDPSKAQLPYVLLGHSFIERLKTTGKKTRIGSQPESECFNAGVGGDKTANVVYRGGDMGLLRSLKGLNPQVCVIILGANDKRKGGPIRTGGKNYALGDKEIETIRNILIAPLRTAPQSRILVRALTYRNDPSKIETDSIIDESNTVYSRMVAELQKEVEWLDFGWERVVWQSEPKWLDKKKSTLMTMSTSMRRAIACMTRRYGRRCSVLEAWDLE